MAYDDDVDPAVIVINIVDHAVVALADAPKPVTTDEFNAPGWTRLMRQALNL
jgi:hypothetical protein